MGKKMTAKKAEALEAAQSREEAEQLLELIGRNQRKVTAIETRMNEKLASVKTEYELEAQPLNAEIESAFSRLHLYAEAHREQLCSDGTKTATLATGELMWRLPPPSVRIQAADVVIERLRKRGLDEFIRTKEEINKEAILAEPEKVKGIAGITITQTEQFVVKPFESDIERATLVKSTK